MLHSTKNKMLMMTTSTNKTEKRRIGHHQLGNIGVTRRFPTKKNRTQAKKSLQGLAFAFRREHPGSRHFAKNVAGFSVSTQPASPKPFIDVGALRPMQIYCAICQEAPGNEERACKGTG
eukprot:m.45599 g.45599  ORF g.45599 m.45599 type:complete len:119 (-) comp47275_c0_seq1:1011-1367(-)